MAALLALASPGYLQAQSSPSGAISISVPRLVTVSGEYRPKDGGSAVPLETVTLRIYSEQSGGVPLWQETQTVAVDPYGFYTMVLGATQKDGIPSHVFSSSEAQWLSMSWARDGSIEGPRARLTSVPYALRAADAETFGGLPPSAYQLTPAYAPRGASTAATLQAVVTTDGGVAPGTVAGAAAGSAAAASTAAATAASVSVVPKAVLNGTPGYLAKYVNATDVSPSAIYEVGGLVGINNPAPHDIIHSRFTNGDGTLTGLAVQNMGASPLSYSGMLFYDQNGNVAQFQGFGNVTHEYRINNVASNASMSFMLGGTPYPKIDSTHKVLVNAASGEASDLTQGQLEVQMTPGGRHGIFVRKRESTTAAAAIEARSAAGFSGPLIKALAAIDDPYDYLANAAVIAANGTGNGYGIYAAGFGYAAVLVGNVSISGSLTKSAGSFRIDHPLDPEHKYLQHSFVESPDMMNVYNGNAVLDGQGEATVMLPDWFQALNRDFRYQLTAVGEPGPNLFIAQKIAGNQFRIAGGMPGGEVSWQVTGIRQDPYANANRIAVELDKARDETGKYLHPKAYGMPDENGIESLRVRTPTADVAPAYRAN